MDREFIDNVIFEIRSRDEDPVDVYNRYIEHADIKPCYNDAKLLFETIEMLLTMDEKLIKKMKSLITERRLNRQ